MTAPTAYLRDLREQQTSRRLGVAKALRESPDATNVRLARMFDVSRNAIAKDRKAIMEQLQNATKTETELLRDGLVKKLEGLVAEVEKHRKDGKLSLSAIDQLLSITKAVIELTGARKPVVETLKVRREPIQFNTVIVPTGRSGEHVHGPGGWRFVPKADVIKEPLALGAGEEKH